jgi:hypothetical protein
MKRFLTVAVAMLALTGMGQVAMRKLEDLTNTNLVCVTDYGPQLVSVTGGLASISGAVAVIQSDLPGLATTQQVEATTAALAAHINRTDNPHGVTAVQIGALTAEQDLAALRAYHYGSPDIVESPAEWFAFDGAGTITAFNWEAGRDKCRDPLGDRRRSGHGYRNECVSGERHRIGDCSADGTSIEVLVF